MNRPFAAVLAMALSLPGLAIAQDSKTEAPAVTADSAAFKALLRKRTDFITKLDSLRKEFAAATDEKQQADIDKQFQAAVVEFRTKTLPALGTAAIAIYTADGENEAAENATIEYLADMLSTNKFLDVAKACDALIKAGRKHPGLYTMDGVARFAIHDFSGAKTLLARAKEIDDEGMPPDAQQFLAIADQYAKWWEEEKAIRAKEDAAGDLPQVLLKTSKGEITIDLFENEAPNTVANFISLVDKKFYDGTKFHRVIGNFMAQGGDPNSKNSDPSDDGLGGPGYSIPCETNLPNSRRHFRGSLSMAHAGKDSGGSQFFLTHRPTPHLNSGWINPLTGKPDINPNTKKPNDPHTVFGRVSKGMDVLMKIEPGDVLQSAAVLRKRDHKYEPKKLPDRSPKIPPKTTSKEPPPKSQE